MKLSSFFIWLGISAVCPWPPGSTVTVALKAGERSLLQKLHPGVLAAAADLEFAYEEL